MLTLVYNRYTHKNAFHLPLQVIQRRENGSIHSDRQWKDYKEGYGFLSSELWLGNEKLAFLTNQKKYQLRIDFESASGNFFY